MSIFDGRIKDGAKVDTASTPTELGTYEEGRFPVLDGLAGLGWMACGSYAAIFPTLLSFPISLWSPFPNWPVPHKTVGLNTPDEGRFGARESSKGVLSIAPQ